MQHKNVRGSITIEMAYIMPLIFMVFFFSIMGIFYYHDKNIIAGCAYETAVIGSTKAREKEGVTEQLLKTVFEERSRGKCILFSGIQTDITIGDKEIIMKATARRKGMGVSVIQRASITEPETYIRDLKRIK